MNHSNIHKYLRNSRSFYNCNKFNLITSNRSKINDHLLNKKLADDINNTGEISKKNFIIKCYINKQNSLDTMKYSVWNNSRFIKCCPYYYNSNSPILNNIEQKKILKKLDYLITNGYEGKKLKTIFDYIQKNKLTKRNNKNYLDKF